MLHYHQMKFLKLFKMKKHVCPWYFGYFLINPFRKFIQDPQKLLINHFKPGMKVIDFGSAMGYFSLPMAKLVRPGGQVFCFDIQQKMLTKLNRRVRNKGLEDIVEPRLISEEIDVWSDVKESIDFVLLFAVIHEVPDPEKVFSTLYQTLKSGGTILFAEPRGHVSKGAFEKSVNNAMNSGFKVKQSLTVNRSHAVLLEKQD